MKKLNLKILIGTIIAFVVVIAFQMQNNKQEENFSGSGRYICGTGVTNSSTTTSATANQLVVDKNSRRCDLELINDSDTTMYLYRGYLGTYAQASTTLISEIGITLKPGGSYYTGGDSVFTNQIWLGTTTAGKVLTISESQ